MLKAGLGADFPCSFLRCHHIPHKLAVWLTAATSTGKFSARPGPPGASNAPLQSGKPVPLRVWGSAHQAPPPLSVHQDTGLGFHIPIPPFWNPPQLPESHRHRGSASSKAYPSDSSAARLIHLYKGWMRERPTGIRYRISCATQIPGRCTATSRAAFHGHARVCESSQLDVYLYLAPARWGNTGDLFYS